MRPDGPGQPVVVRADHTQARAFRCVPFLSTISARSLRPCRIRVQHSHRNPSRGDCPPPPPPIFNATPASVERLFRSSGKRKPKTKLCLAAAHWTVGRVRFLWVLPLVLAAFSVDWMRACAISTGSAGFRMSTDWGRGRVAGQTLVRQARQQDKADMSRVFPSI